MFGDRNTTVWCLLCRLRTLFLAASPVPGGSSLRQGRSASFSRRLLPFAGCSIKPFAQRNNPRSAAFFQPASNGIPSLFKRKASRNTAETLHGAAPLFVGSFRRSFSSSGGQRQEAEKRRPDIRHHVCAAAKQESAAPRGRRREACDPRYEGGIPFERCGFK